MIIKKIISVLLCFALILSALCFSSLAENKELKITVTTDTHYQSLLDVGTLAEEKANEANTNGMLNKDMYFYATTQGQLNFESSAIMHKFLDEFINSDSQYILIAGDLTCGKRQSHYELAKLLKETELKSGKEIFVINGNHDCYAESDDLHINIDEFKTIYADFGYNQALNCDKNSGSYSYNLDDNHVLLAIDSCIYGKDEGQITESTLNWIKAQCLTAKADGKQIIAMMHHSILPHFALQTMIDNYGDLAKEFMDMGIEIVYTGHMHANDISSAEFDNNVLYDVQTGSLISSPNAYRTVTYTDKSAKIESKYITEIDTQYLADGYTDEQMNAIKNNFSEYSYNFFEAGVCRWINRYLGSAGKAGKLLKFDADSKEYEILNDIILNVGDALALPIYDDGNTPDVIDSIEEITDIVGVELPKTDYERPYQVAFKIMIGFYHGDEDISVNDVEIPLLLTCIKACLALSVTNIVFNNSVMSTVDDLNNSLTGIKFADVMFNNLLRFNFNDGLIDYVVQSLVSPLLEGFSCDLSEPSDINLTIEFNSTEPDVTVPISIFEKIFKFILKFLKSFFEVAI